MFFERLGKNKQQHEPMKFGSAGNPAAMREQAKNIIT